MCHEEYSRWPLGTVRHSQYHSSIIAFAHHGVSCRRHAAGRKRGARSTPRSAAHRVAPPWPPSHRHGGGESINGASCTAARKLRRWTRRYVDVQLFVSNTIQSRVRTYPHTSAGEAECRRPRATPESPPQPSGWPPTQDTPGEPDSAPAELAHDCRKLPEIATDAASLRATLATIDDADGPGRAGVANRPRDRPIPPTGAFSRELGRSTPRPRTDSLRRRHRVNSP